MYVVVGSVHCNSCMPIVNENRMNIFVDNLTIFIFYLYFEHVSQIVNENKIITLNQDVNPTYRASSLRIYGDMTNSMLKGIGPSIYY